jgi:protein-disulfide isomerase
MTLALLALMMAAQAAAGSQPVPAQPLASVEIVVFSDFQCPFCAMFAQSLRELQTSGVDGIKTTFTFKNFPLSIHPRAPLVHQAALAAAEQGKFWEMHDMLFANQQRAQRDDLIGFAKQLGLDMPRFLGDLESERIKRVIATDMADGNRLHVTGTPAFFVNGQEYVGTRSLAQLKQLVEGEYLSARAVAEITDDLTSKGPATATITIELFADLQSPVSRPAAAVLDELMKRYPSELRLQFRNFPLAFHPQAPLAHEAAMTAARAGRFWEFVTYALDHQDALREQDLIALAGRLGLDASEFARTIQEHRYAPRVKADVRTGLNKGIRGSPVMFVNGRRIDGVPSLQTLIEHVEAELSARPIAQP